MRIEISSDYYEELLRYKALYENEKSHTETLKAIINKLLDEDIDGLYEERSCDCEKCAQDQYQIRELEDGFRDVIKTVESYFYED